jgi:hypothetical protein
MNLHCTLDRLTVAARRAVVRLGDLGNQPPPSEPLVIQTRACAFLNPFGAPTGMILTEGDSLRQGVMVWQSTGDVYDKRLHFAAAVPNAIPGTAQTHAAWRLLWGSGGDRRSVTHLPLTARLDRDRWLLTRLALPVFRGRPPFDPRDAGADLVQLGIIKKTRK